MKRTTVLVGVVLLLATLAMAACGGSPQATPTPTSNPTPTPTASSSGSGTTATPTQSSSSSAWDQIVQKAKQEGTVTQYGTGLISGSQGQQIAAAFKQDTGITLNVIAGAGAPTFQRLQQEDKAGQHNADVLAMAPTWTVTTEQAGYYLPLKNYPLPIFGEPQSAWILAPTSLDPQQIRFIPSTIGEDGHVVVNTSLLSPSDYPTSFDQIATDPKYKGKIMWDDPNSTQDNSAWWMRWGYVAGALSLKDVWDIYTQQSPVLQSDPNTEASAFAQGQAAILMGNNLLDGPAKQGAPIQLIRFAGIPTVGSSSTYGVYKNAPHLDAALVYINWLYSKAGMQAVTQIGGWASLRTDVPSGEPPALAKPVDVGQGQPGPWLNTTLNQVVMASYVYKNAKSAWTGLTQGISESDFESAVNSAVAQWESQNGGPQHQGIPMNRGQ